MFNPTTPHGGGNQTTALITDATAPVSPTAIEYFRVPASGMKDPVFGFRRSFLYSLLAQKKIHSVAIRNRGAKKAVRLVSADSVRKYLASLMAEQNANGTQEDGAI